MVLEELLTELAARKNKKRWGIGTAAQYLKGLSPETLDVDPAEWSAVLKAAERVMTYCAPDMFPVKRASKVKTEGAIMEFDAIVTSNRIDRDGDILEPKGARVDERSPLLWQHSPMHPIGKLVGVLGQNTKRVSARFAIADTPLGREAAEMVKFGALRISHGFNPEEYEERTKGGKGDDAEDFLGWHITKYEIMEVSLVSVPSNADAVITAIEDAKLHDPAVKALAELWGNRLPDIRQREKLFPVTLPPTVATEKSGRTLSKANEGRIRDARESCLLIAHNGENMPVKAVTTMAHDAMTKLDAVLEQLDEEDGDGKATEPVKVIDIDKSLACATMPELEAEMNRREAEEYGAAAGLLVG